MSNMTDGASWLTGKTALITGAAKRIGRATALALADEGVNVVVHHNRSSDEAQEVAELVRQKGVGAWTLRADLADADEAAALFGQATDRAGAIDVLVNNASTFHPSRLADIGVAEVLSDLQVNALSPFVLARAMAAQRREGAIVNFLDCRIAEYDASHVAYNLSKRMLFTLTRMMALAFAPGVRVNAVAPGLILPPPGKDESYLRKLAPTDNPLQRIGALTGITDAVVFLLRSPFVTGQVIFVDGGRHMKGSTYGGY
jgi:NAD(P)-dependent dehydrogenase (short-subunit alcohol dehydrogenase family)